MTSVWWRLQPPITGTELVTNKARDEPCRAAVDLIDWLIDYRLSIIDYEFYL